MSEHSLLHKPRDGGYVVEQCAMRMTFRPIYLVAATAIFVVEVAIAAGYFPGVFVRNSLGDVLATALIYCVVRGLSSATWFVALVISVSAGFTVEFLQYLHVADVLGLKPGSITSMMLGATFSWSDMVMYSIGSCVVAWLDVRVLYARHASKQRADRLRTPGAR